MAVDAAAFPGAAAAEAAKAGSAHVDMAKLQRSGGIGHLHHQPRHLTKAEESKAMTVFTTLFLLMMLGTLPNPPCPSSGRIP